MTAAGSTKGRRVARVGLSALIALDLVALTATALHRTSTTTTVQQRRVAELARPAPVVLSPAPATTTPPLSPPSVIAQPVVATTPSPSATPSSSSAPTTPASPPPTTPSATPVACPLPLSPPATNGGLQSLISLSPAFGPFSAEAFAMASAYQPVLQLLGPILAQYPKLAAKAQPEINAFLVPWESLLNSLFGLINPYYAPYRQQVLTAETKFAAFLAPYAEELASSPLGGCLVDVEAALVGDTKNPVTGKVTKP